MLIYNNIHSQQNANNVKRAMRMRDGFIRFCHHFFFSLPFVGHHVFVEDELNIYYTIYQCIAHHIQQFNAFLAINKSTGKWQGNPSQNYLCRHAVIPTRSHDNMTARNHDDIPTWAMMYHPKPEK